MKRILLFCVIFLSAFSVLAKTVTPAASLPTYYQQIDGKAGKTLFDAVQKVTKTGYSSGSSSMRSSGGSSSSRGGGGTRR